MKYVDTEIFLICFMTLMLIFFWICCSYEKLVVVPYSNIVIASTVSMAFLYHENISTISDVSDNHQVSLLAPKD